MGMINGAPSFLCAVFALLLMSSLALSPTLRRRPASRPALLMLIFVFISLSMDAVSFFCFEENRDLFNLFLTTANVSAFFTEWFFGLFFVSQVRVSKLLKRSILAAIGALCLIGSVLYIINGIHPFFFDFKKYEYLPATGYWIYSTFSYLFFVGSAVLLLFNAEHISLRDKIIPISTIFFPLLSVLSDSLLPGLYAWDILVFMAVATNYVHLMFVIVESAEQKIERLELKRVRATIERIKPHYIYNVLSSIYYLCDTDAKLAQEAIGIFSDYLRDVLEVMETDTLISFEHELRTVQNYLELEQMRFGDKLRVRYDVEVKDFLLPPFTVQPLVENAVKHGVARSDAVGEILISTRETEDAYYVSVRDTCGGFDTEAPDDGARHSGTAYIRKILAETVGGSLKIKSTPGVGTTAAIRLPKKP